MRGAGLHGPAITREMPTVHRPIRLVDYGRPPRGRSVFAPAALVGVAFVFLMLARAGWV